MHSFPHYLTSEPPPALSVVTSPCVDLQVANADFRVTFSRSANDDWFITQTFVYVFKRLNEHRSRSKIPEFEVSYLYYPNLLHCWFLSAWCPIFLHFFHIRSLYHFHKIHSNLSFLLFYIAHLNVMDPLLILPSSTSLSPIFSFLFAFYPISRHFSHVDSPWF